jgi:FkbM family methyltransferase
MVENIKANWNCIDAGANVGYHALLMARLAHEGLVHAFEPTRTFYMLQENVRHAGLSNLVLNKTALGASNHGGERLYRIWGGRPERYSGKWTTVDEYLGSQASQALDFLKVDVDGFDLEVLQGAKKSIASFRPVVLVEINHALATRGKTASDVFEFMLGLKYEHALVLDSDNYVFTSSWSLGEPWPKELRIAFDFRDALDMSQDVFGLASDSKKVSSLLVRPHNKSGFNGGICNSYGPAWQYCLEFSGAQIWGRGKAVQIDVEVLGGSLGVFFTDSQGKRIIDRERIVKRGRPVRIVFEEVPEKARSLMFRKTTDEDLEFSIGQVLAGTLVKTIGENDTSPGGSFSTLADSTPTNGDLGSKDFSSSPNGIQKGNAQGLANWLKIESPPVEMESRSAFNSYDHTMEREDAHYLSWLWSSLATEKHFEFGTWEGFGTCLVLKSTQAHVWTLNLATGEQGPAGAQYTESREPELRRLFLGAEGLSSDADSSVGWMYRSLGLSERVTQLLGDSSEFDHLFLGEEYFDTVFIDGGHQAEIVSSDQKKAIEMLRRGGVVVWHDYSEDEKMLREHPSCEGVVSAVVRNRDFLESQLDLFWLKGSFLLIGKKR